MAPTAMSALSSAALAAAFAWFADALPAEIRGRQVLVGGKPLHMKGVNWNPVPIGEEHPDGVDFPGYVDLDVPLMRSAGINVIRTYEPLIDREVLDKIWGQGLQVVNTLWANGKEPLSNITERVEAVKDHPAILMWSIGNEWNLNHCYKWSMGFHGCLAKIREAVQLVKSLDSTHPVATVYGMLPGRGVIAALPEVDIWGINYYDGLHMQGMLWKWSQLSHKPVFLGEYGADAYNSYWGDVDERAQAHATTVLTQKIVDYSSVTGGFCAGGFIFEFADEWWKDGSGSNKTHDVGGVAPGGGPHPDRTFNEEWWGLVDMHRKPRLAYHAYSGSPLPTAAAESDTHSGLSSDTGLACTAAGCQPRPVPEGCHGSFPAEADAAGGSGAATPTSEASQSLRR